MRDPIGPQIERLFEDRARPVSMDELTPNVVPAPPVSVGKRLALIVGVSALAGLLVFVAASIGPAEDPVITPDGTDWEAVELPPGMASANELAVWTSEEIVFWGGQDDTVDSAPTGEPGLAYNPDTKQWRTLPPSGKKPTIGAAGVWTGEEVIICCGGSDRFADFAETVAYDPSTDSWRSLADAPISGTYSEAVWTGEQMLVVASNGVAAYDPATNSWSTFPEPPDEVTVESVYQIPWRISQIIWTGDELIGWSREVERVAHRGFALNPTTGEWRLLPEPPAWPAAPDMVWTGEKLILWGGLPAHRGGSERAVGSVYDPETDSWVEMSEALPEPDGFEGNLGSQSMVWTGDRALISTGAFGSGVDPINPLLLTYDPDTDTWEHIAETVLPATAWPQDLIIAGDRVVYRANKLYISPPGWIPDGDLVTADSWSVTTTTSTTTTTIPATTSTQPPPPYMFVPTPQITQDRAILPVAFLDGTTATLSWPVTLDLLADGVGTSGWGAVNDLGSNSARTIIAIPETREMVIDRFGTGELLATYADGEGGLVQFRRFPVDTTADYLVFDFGVWTVLVYDYQKNSDGRMTEASREIWSSHLSSTITDEGFLALVADPPLILAGAGESPPVALGFVPPGGQISMTLTPCVPNETIEDEPNSLSWCNDSGEVSITVHSIDVEFRNAVRTSLVVSDIRGP